MTTSIAEDTPCVVHALGNVHGIRGSRVTAGILAAALNGLQRELITVGKFVKISTAQGMAVGMIAEVAIQRSPTSNLHDYCATAEIDLLGEFSVDSGNHQSFRRGIRGYPTIGDLISPLTTKELQIIFNATSARTITLGSLQQDADVLACVDVDEMLTKHFAVLGSTGVGKSSALAHILMQAMKARPSLRVFMLDPHNEYGGCFGDRGNIVNPSTLRLPFWLFNFEEIVDVLFGARPGSQEEIDILSEVIPIAKNAYNQHRSPSDRVGIKRIESRANRYTIDSPTPYRLADLIAIIDERMGKLENRSSRMIHHKLLTRIETVSNDSRYTFMFDSANVGGDTMAEAISYLFRLPANGKPITVMQLAGFPTEAADAMVSVLARLAFDFGVWSEGSDPLLFVCEEAHKYAAADRAIGFGPTRRAISRIAKEGRKYGIYLGLVTQRPAELDATIISQCGTLLAMRMTNERDQALLRSTVADAAANLFDFVPSLGVREALAVGSGMPLPTWLTFEQVQAHVIPRSDTLVKSRRSQSESNDRTYVASVIDKWRSTTGRQPMAQQPEPVGLATVTSAVSPAASDAKHAVVPSHLDLLKRPTVDKINSAREAQRFLRTPRA